MRIHPAICPRETLPRPLLVPLPLSPSLFLLFFLSYFYSFLHALTSLFSPSHTSPLFLFYLPILTVLTHLSLFVPPLYLLVYSLRFSATCISSSLSSQCVCVCLCLCCGGSGCRVKVLPYSDRRLSECSVGAIHRG